MPKQLDIFARSGAPEDRKKGDQPLARNMSTTVAPESINLEERTVVVEFTTDAVVDMPWWRHPAGRERAWTEVLSMKPEHIKLERALSGAFHSLNNHNRWDVKDVVARAVPGTAETTGKGVRVTLKFRDTEEAMALFRSIADGSFGGWSCLYKVYQYEPIKMGAEGTAEKDQFRAILWEPLTADPVCIPADYHAGVRAEIIDHGRKTVDEEELIGQEPDSKESRSETPPEGDPKAKSEPSTTPKPKASTDSSRSSSTSPEAMAAERARCADIASIFSKMQLPGDEARALIEEGATVDEARARAIELDVARREKEGTAVSVSNLNSSITIPKRDEMIRACSEAMVLKSRGKVEEPHELTRELKDMPVLEIMRRGLIAHGSDPGQLYGNALMRNVMTTAFFGAVVQDFVRRRAGVEYRGPQRNYEGLFNEVSVQDFRPVQVVSAQEGLELKQAKEDEEVEYTSVAYAEDSSYQMATFRGGFKIGYRVFVNDDLHLLDREFRKVDAASTRLHRQLIIEPLVGGTFKVFGKNLFDASHKNTVTAAAFDLASYEAAETKLYMQKGPNGKHELELNPKFLLVAKANRLSVTKELYGNLSPNAKNDLNVAALYSSLPEARVLTELDRTSNPNMWFLVADPMDMPTLELAYMDGERDPVITTQEWDDKEDYKVAFRQNVGVACVNYRGIVRVKPA